MIVETVVVVGGESGRFICLSCRFTCLSLVVVMNVEFVVVVGEDSNVVVVGGDSIIKGSPLTLVVVMVACVRVGGKCGRRRWRRSRRRSWCRSRRRSWSRS